MSSVSPASETSNFYLRDLGRIEDEIRSEAQKTRDRNDEQLKNLQEKYENAYRQKDEATNATIQKIRDSSNEALNRERENHGAALDQLRDESLNNRGISGAGYTANGSLISQYRRTAEELQKELDANSEKFRANHDIAVKNLQDNNRIELNRKEKEFDSTVKSLRDSRYKDLQMERQQINSELERLRAHENIHPGPIVPYETYKSEMDSLMESSQLRHEKDAQINEDYRNESERRFDDLNQRQNDKIESMADQQSKTLQSIQDKSEGERKLLNQEINRLRKENNTVKGNSVPYETYKREMNNLSEASRVRHEIDAKNADLIHDDTEYRLGLIDQRQTEKVRSLEAQQAEEVRALRDQVSDLNEYNSSIGKQHSEELAKYARENANTARTENKRLNDSYNETLQKLKNDFNQVEERYAHRGDELTRQKEEKLTQVIKNQNKENSDRIRVIEKQFNDEIQAADQSKRASEKQMSDRTDRLLAQAEEQRTASLEKQNQTFQNTMNREKKESDEQINLLQKTLQHQRTSPDLNDISPSAEAALRKTLIQEYEKSLNSETERNKNTEEHLQRTYREAYQQALQDSKDRETELFAQKTRDDIMQRGRLMESMNETEYVTSAKIRDQEAQHSREKDNLYRRFNSTLERQKREFNQIFSADRSYTDNRIAELQNDSNASTRNAIRIANTKQNELIHDYEKRLVEQKEDSDVKLEETKVQAQVDLRELERRSKHELELQAKSYEQRIAQIEIQNKERERYAAQNYQDELDRTRRAYELAGKKKS